MTSMCIRLFLLFTFLGLVIFKSVSANQDKPEFTERDIQYLKTFTLASLQALPEAFDNQFADDLDVAEFGRTLFFDANLSANQEVACSSCHQPKNYFTDMQKVATGIASTTRNTPTLLGASYGPWKYWDGRKDSLWAQALSPLEAPEEHGFSRQLVFDYVLSEYAETYEKLFGKIADQSEQVVTRVFVNVGKALMAYQRQLQIPESRFDHYIETLEKGGKGDFTASEVSGLRLFMGKAACMSCHNGPLFTNFEFHNVGVPEADESMVDLGRYVGIEQLRNDEFNCQSQWSDVDKSSCEELIHLKKSGPELVGAFKTPSLRNIADTSPYMHAGQFLSLEQVVIHYSQPSPPYYDRKQHPFRPHFDVMPLNLNGQEILDLVAFLKTLSGPIPDNDPWWSKPAVQLSQ